MGHVRKAIVLVAVTMVLGASPLLAGALPFDMENGGGVGAWSLGGVETLSPGISSLMYNPAAGTVGGFGVLLGGGISSDGQTSFHGAVKTSVGFLGVGIGICYVEESGFTQSSTEELTYGEFSLKTVMGDIALSLKLRDIFAVGICVYGRRMDTPEGVAFSSTGFGFGVGAYLGLGPIRLSLAIKDLGGAEITTYKGETYTDTVGFEDAVWSVSGALDMGFLGAGVKYEGPGGWVHVGAKFRPVPILEVRAGIVTSVSTGGLPTWFVGVGFLAGPLRVGYGMSILAPGFEGSPVVHRFQLLAE